MICLSEAKFENFFYIRRKKGKKVTHVEKYFFALCAIALAVRKMGGNERGRMRGGISTFTRFSSVEVVAESVDGLGRGGFVGRLGRGMEADEVDPAVEPLEQAHQLGSMAGVVVEVAEHDILKRYAPLAAPVVAAQQCYDIGYGIGPLHGHDVLPLGGKGVVQTHSHMALAFVEESLQSRDDAHGGDGDALGAPAQPPGGSEHLSTAQHSIKIIHRLTHAHIDDIGELVELGDGKNLVEDVGGGEAAMEPLLAGDTETAAHPAAHLAGDAEGGTVAVGDIYRLNVLG